MAGRGKVEAAVFLLRCRSAQSDLDLQGFRDIAFPRQRELDGPATKFSHGGWRSSDPDSRRLRNVGIRRTEKRSLAEVVVGSTRGFLQMQCPHHVVALGNTFHVDETRRGERLRIQPRERPVH